jgi:hypothetical protein
MADEYKIYLVNNTQSTQIFWVFLAAPDELASDPNVFANSSANLAVASMAPGNNSFTIPVQYVLSAGASNQAVGLDVKVDSSITNKVMLTELWEAQYQTVPPQMGPAMIRQPDVTPKDTLGIKANSFNQAKNETAGWFSSMSFGIKTAAGFMGMSWSPDPGTKRIIKPKLEFYVTTGNFDSNTMADWTTVSTDAQKVVAPSDFKLGATTVTRTDTGGWNITPGGPPNSTKARVGYSFGSLVRSHLLLAQSHADLIDAARAGASDQQAEAQKEMGGVGGVQTDVLASVTWDNISVDGSEGGTHLTGTLTVTTALTAAFAVFILAGVTFNVTSSTRGSTRVRFSYSGTRSAQAIKDLFVAGASLFFSPSEASEDRSNLHPRQLPASV